MDHTTYDPIIEVRALSRVRVIAPRAPEVDEALVLAPRRGPMLTIRHGDPIPGARFADYRRLYLVDVAEHRLTLDFALLSRDHTFAFNARTTLTCQVTAPEKVVARNIRDMSGALYGPLKTILQEAAKRYDIGDFHPAQEALNREMRYFTGDAAIRLHGIHIELLVDEEEAAESGRSFRDVIREQRLADVKIDHQLDRLRSTGVEGLIADILEREGPAAALARIREIEGEERSEILNAWETVLKHTDEPVEPYLLIEAHKELLGKYIEGSSAPFGGTRSGRLRGSMKPSIIGSIEPPHEPPHEVASAEEPGGSRPRPRRDDEHHVPLTDAGAETPTGPPDDEPPGGLGDSPNLADTGPRRDSGTRIDTAWDSDAAWEQSADDTEADDAASGASPGEGPVSRLRGFRTGEPGR
ncbi:hypothetical protein [Actinomadura sp. 3N508]|uniref:hypothetical protein n=1 Tax=Actinomadura sp. 3N508 TaxID=3375153 RepID=UPI0037A0194B